jgi:hypothetical protein
LVSIANSASLDHTTEKSPGDDAAPALLSLITIALVSQAWFLPPIALTFRSAENRRGLLKE